MIEVSKYSSPRMYEQVWTTSVKCHAGMLNMFPVCMSTFVGQEVGLMKDCQPGEMLGIPFLTMEESNMRSPRPVGTSVECRLGPLPACRLLGPKRLVLWRY